MLPRRRSISSLPGSGPLAFCGILIAAKLWLVAPQEIYGLAFANYDDALFLRLADFIGRGEWLGPYDHLTLAKGPMYPIFIAACHLAQVPLPFAQQVFYAGACAAFVCAARPLLPRDWARVALFALLLFNPVTFDMVIHSRVLRQNILHSLALYTVAGFVGAATRTQIRARWPWAVLGGTALSAFWLTREESVWLLPCIGALWLVWAIRDWRDEHRLVPIRLACLALPAALWGGGLAVISSLNWSHYGVFTTCDFKDRELQDAYGALVRIATDGPRPYLPVPRATRERIYAVSPAFASLRDEFEGPTGEAWAGITGFLTHRPPAEREIASVWFIWALRRAVQDTGQAPDAVSARAFYARLAVEVNAACESGRLPAGPRRSGFLPPLGAETWRRLPRAIGACLREIVTFDHLAVRPQGPSLGRPEELEIFSRLTRARLIPTDGSWARPATPWSYRAIRYGVLDAVRRTYAAASPLAGLLAMLLWLVAVVRLPGHGGDGFAIALSGGALAAVVAMAGIVALIDVTTFPAVETGYFSATYALWLLFIFFGFLSALRSFRPAGPRAPA